MKSKQDEKYYSPFRNSYCTLIVTNCPYSRFSNIYQACNWHSKYNLIINETFNCSSKKVVSIRIPHLSWVSFGLVLYHSTHISNNNKKTGACSIELVPINLPHNSDSALKLTAWG